MMMKKKKKQSRSQSFVDNNPNKTLESSLDSSSPSPRLLSIFRSKLVSGKDLKHMFRGRSKTAPGLSSQSRIVRCPKCQKLLQEPIDATTYKCSGCDSILQAKRWELEGNHNSIPKAFLSSQNRSLSTEVESGSKTPMRSTHREYNLRALPSVERGYHSETVYKHETSDIRKEWMRKADDFGDSDEFNSRSNASEWTQCDGRYNDLPRVPFYPASPSPSSAYEYGYSSPFHGSQASASEQSYYHYHHPNQFKRYGSEGWFQESSSVASPLRFTGETSDGKYNHCSSQSQLNDRQYHNLYESSSSATRHRSVYSERSYQAVAAPQRSTYSAGIAKSEASSERSSLRNKKKYVKAKNPVLKRHVLPSAGGAPFATCSYCLQLLQLPQVSLSLKQKRYQVRCGSCSGLLKFSIQEKADNVFDSPSFVDSSTGLADETANTHQDSASEGRKEISPDDSHLSNSDNGYVDRISKSTYEDKRIKEDLRSISSKVLDSEMEALQPQWKPLLASSETIGETSRIHLEEAHIELSSEMDDNIFERTGRDLEESGYEKNGIHKPEEMLRGESLEVARVVSHTSKTLNANEYVCDTHVMSENNKDTRELDQEETGENDTEHISSTFSEAMSATLQSTVKASVTDNENLCGRQELDKTTSDRVRYELEEKGEDGLIASLEKASETFETIIEGEIGAERSVAHQVDSSTENIENFYEPLYFEGSGYASERTWAEGDRAGLHLEEYESNFEIQSKPFEWTSERASMVCLNENELVTTLEAEDDVDGRSEERHVFHESQYDILEQSQYENSSERQELSNTVSEIVTSELQKCRYEANEMLEPSNTVGRESVVSLEKASEVNIGEKGEERSVSHQMAPQYENLENFCRTVEPVYLDGTRAETIGEEYQSNPFEWTSETAPTNCLHKYELEIMPGTYQDSNGRSRSSSIDSFSDHESSKDIAASHEEKFQLVNETRTNALQIGETSEDGSLVQLENCEENEEAMEVNETFEWTSGRTLTFRLREYEQETILEEDENERAEFDKAIELRDDRFLLCSDDILELETNIFRLETSQDKEDNDAKHTEVDSQTKEETQGDQLEQPQKVPMSHFSDTTEPPTEIVGLRLALYQTQSSPLRSPLTSPIHTPIGSPLHYLMRSPITSPINSHIVSPMRSPINSSGSLSDVLFFGNKT